MIDPNQEIERLELELERVQKQAAAFRDALEKIAHNGRVTDGDVKQDIAIAALSGKGDNDYITKADVKPLLEALKPFAAIGPVRAGSIPPDKLWLWKNNSTTGDLPGISAADINNAKQVYDNAKAKGWL